MRCIFLVREGIGVSGVKKSLEKKWDAVKSTVRLLGPGLE